MLYPVSSQLEFCRTRELEIESSDYEMQLLSHMPADELAWYCEVLLIAGDLLISSGTKLKASVHSTSTPLSQEIR